MIHMLIGHPLNSEKIWFKDVLEFKLKEFIDSSLGDSEIDKLFKHILPRMVTHDYESRINPQELSFELFDFLSQHII